jgi:hypothetical protein
MIEDEACLKIPASPKGRKKWDKRVAARSQAVVFTIPLAASQRNWSTASL